MKYDDAYIRSIRARDLAGAERWVAARMSQPCVGHVRILRVDPGDYRRALVRCEFEGCGREFSAEIKLLKKEKCKTCGHHGDRPRQLARVAGGALRMIDGATAGDWKIEKILLSKRLYSMKCKCGKVQVMRRVAVTTIFDNPILQTCTHATCNKVAPKPAPIVQTADEKAVTADSPTQSQRAPERKKKMRKRPGLCRADLRPGMKIGMLEIVDLKPNDRRKIQTLCHGRSHEAPKEHFVALHSILSGAASSCGCERLDNIRKTRKERGTSKVVPGTVWHNWRIMSWGYKRQYVWAVCTACEGGIAWHVHSASIVRAKSKSCGCKALDYQATTNLERYGSFRPASNSSVIEQDLFAWVSSLCPDAVQQKKIGSSVYDIFIPSKNLLIEMNGAYWHSEGGLYYRWKQRAEYQSDALGSASPAFGVYARNYHLHKYQEAGAYGYDLIQIWDFQWITRRPQVKSFLGAKLGNCRSIGARKLDFQIIPAEAASGFCNRFHIQGSPGHITLAIGGFEAGELRVVGTFGPHHRSGEAVVVMSRYCVQDGYVVPGALAKISQMAYRELQQPIKTWADNTLSRGAGYFKAGWRLEAELPPDYFYISEDTQKIYSKSSQRKHGQERQMNLTERELRLKEGKYRVWDAGKKLFVFDPGS